MDKIWLQSYPPGMPAEINPDRYSSLVQLLEESFSKFADRNAFVCMDKFLTYRELDAYSQKLAAWLQSRGLTPGARVAIMMPNVLQYPIALAAVLRAGYVVVNVNPLYTARELEHQITDSGAEAIIVLEKSHAAFQILLRNTVVRLNIGWSVFIRFVGCARKLLQQLYHEIAISIVLRGSMTSSIGLFFHGDTWCI